MVLNMCHGQKSRFFGDGKPPTFNDGLLIMGPYKPLRDWVDEFPSPVIWKCHGSSDPIAHMVILTCQPRFYAPENTWYKRTIQTLNHSKKHGTWQEWSLLQNYRGVVCPLWNQHGNGTSTMSRYANYLRSGFPMPYVFFAGGLPPILQ